MPLKTKKEKPILDVYLMLNPVHTSDIIVISLLVIFLNEPELICFHIVKWFHIG